VAVIEVPDAGGDFVEEVVVVRNEEDRAFVTLEREY